MKKIKNLLLIMTFTLCVTILPNYVKAHPTAENFKMYCPSDTIALGETGNCYFLAKITEEEEKGVDHIFISIGGLGKLTIVNAFAYEPSDVSVKKINVGEKSASGDECTEYNECYDFVAASGKTIRNLGTSKLNIKELNDNVEWQGYSVIGYWTLKFADDAVVDDYGRLCPDVSYSGIWGDGSGYKGAYLTPAGGCNDMVKAVAAKTTCEVKDGKYYKNGTEVTQDEYQKTCELTVSTPICAIKDGKYYGSDGKETTKEEFSAQCEPTKITCQVKDNKYYGKNGDEVTQDEYKKQCSSITPPNTGSFASYAVLAAGAFIALSTITIAKKHNKFYKV